MSGSCDISPQNTDDRLSLAEQIIGHQFDDRSLLQEALTHPSYLGDHPGNCMYERLEFLGDAVLDLIVVEEVFRRFPDLPEGVMTKLKIVVVSGTTLSAVAGDVGLDRALFLGESERGTDGRGMPSALENALEALLGAVYLDGGLDVARTVALGLLGHLIEPSSATKLDHPKSRLQELLQARGATPLYRTIAEDGPPHDRVFTVEVLIDGAVAGVGSGRSKKAAEMDAASSALEDMG